MLLSRARPPSCCCAEFAVREQVKQRDWPLHKDTSRGDMLQLHATWAGLPVRVGWLRPPSGPLVRRLGSCGASFVRLDVGTAPRTPRHWAVWHDEPGKAHQDDESDGVVVQAASGAGWLSLVASFACGAVGPDGFRTVSAVFSALESLVDPSEGALRGSAVLEMDPTWSAVDWQLPPNRHGREQWMLGVGTLGSAALAIPLGAAVHLTEAGIAWAVAAVFTGVGLIGAARLQKILSRPPPEAEALAELFRTSGVFDCVVGPRVANSLSIPVVVERGLHRTLATASVASALLSGSDTARNLELRTVVRRVVWPRSAHRWTRLLPRRWVAAELRGEVACASGAPQWLSDPAANAPVRGVLAGRERSALDAGRDLAEWLRSSCS